MWVWILWVAVGLVVLGLGLALTVVVTMRTKNPRGLGVIRRFHRRYTNRSMLRDAGEPGAYAALIRHVGRRSGKPYATPIGVFPKDDGFLVLLPYGADADWLRNIRAAGSAELRADGRTHLVTPQVVGLAEALPYLSAGNRRIVRLLGLVDFLVLRPAPVPADDGR